MVSQLLQVVVSITRNITRVLNC